MFRRGHEVGALMMELVLRGRNASALSLEEMHWKRALRKGHTNALQEGIVYKPGNGSSPTLNLLAP